MEDRKIEESVRETIEDLKKKIDSLSEAAKDDDVTVAEKINTVKNKAVKVFQDVGERLGTLIENNADEEELSKAIDTIRTRSKDLYDSALNKINEIKGSVNGEEAPENKEEKQSDPFYEVTKSIGNIVDDAKEGIDTFMNRDDVKETVNKAKSSAVDIAEKTLEILRGWLKPEGDDK